NAVSIAAARTKGIVSDVAGQADVLVVPDLESGNMLAKQVMYMGEAASAGIVMGAKVPVVLTSRADSRESRLASCAIALMLAHRYRGAAPRPGARPARPSQPPPAAGGGGEAGAAPGAALLPPPRAGGGGGGGGRAQVARASGSGPERAPIPAFPRRRGKEPGRRWSRR